MSWSVSTPMRAGIVSVCLFLALPLVSAAAPFVICDSYAAPAVIPDYFRLTVDGGAEFQVPPWSGTMADGTVLVNALHYDLATVAVGTHVVTAKACKAATVWQGEACSVASPFSFGRPAAVVPPGATTGLSLSR